MSSIPMQGYAPSSKYHESVKQLSGGWRAVMAEDFGESLLDVLAKEKRVLNLRSVEAGTE